MKPLKIGLTGGIASGKTAAQHFFEKNGVKAIDHDVIARQLVEPGKLGLIQLMATFGEIILAPDQTLDRQKLKAMIFTDQSIKKKVESILHPLIFQESNALIQLYHAETYVLIVSPLLIESGSAATMDILVVVDVSKEQQLQRLLTRDNITEDFGLSIINSQVTQQERRLVADILINNTGDLAQLEIEVSKAHALILKHCHLKSA